MKKPLLYLLSYIFYLNTNAQITITNKLVIDSLKSRINSIHATIYKAIASGQLLIYDNEGEKIKPSEVLTNCVNTGKVDCDSSKASIDEFKYFRFIYLKKFDIETMNTRLKIESLDILYPYLSWMYESLYEKCYNFNFEELEKILSIKDWAFIKYLSVGYYDTYIEGDFDTITYSSGRKTLAISNPLNKEYKNYEADRIAATVGNGYLYFMKVDDLLLEISSMVLFDKFNRQDLIRKPFKFYKDEKLTLEIDNKKLLFDVFHLEWSTAMPDSIEIDFVRVIDTFISIERDFRNIKSIIINENYCKVVFLEDKPSDYSLSKIKNDEYAKKIPTPIYYIKPENLVDLLGKYQYLFLQNLFGFGGS